MFVGNLAFRTNWQLLKDHFKQAGNVVHADVMPGKGCGIVEFETPEEAAAAIQTLHDTELEGRLIFVREDREDFELKGSGGGGGGGGGAPRPPPGAGKRGRFQPGQGPMSMPGAHGGQILVGRRCYVSNLPWECTWQDLKDHFASAGNVVYADVMSDETGRSKGCGIVEFERPDEALRAIGTMSNTNIGGRNISVREDREDRELGGGGGGGGGPPQHHGHPMGAMGGFHGGYQGPPRGPVGNFGAGYGGPPMGYAGGPPQMMQGGGGGASGRQIVVHGIPYHMRWQDLKDLFKQCGNVLRADIVTDETGRSKGYGTILFDDAQCAQAAIATFSEQEYEGRKLSVKLDKFA